MGSELDCILDSSLYTHMCLGTSSAYSLLSLGLISCVCFAAWDALKSTS